MTVDRNILSAGENAPLATLSRRVEALERDNRRWKRIAVLAAAALGAVALLGMGPPPTKTLDLELLRIVDSKGKARVVLGMGDDGPTLSMFDEKGRLRTNLGVAKEGPSLDLLDTAESPRAQLMVDSKQDPHLDFTDEKGTSVSLRP